MWLSHSRKFFVAAAIIPGHVRVNVPDAIVIKSGGMVTGTPSLRDITARFH